RRDALEQPRAAAPAARPVTETAPIEPKIAADLKLPDPATFVTYLNGRRIGTSIYSYTHTTFEGQPAILEEIETVLKYRAGGDVERKEKYQRYSSLDNRMLFVRAETADGHASSKLEARFKADHI